MEKYSTINTTFEQTKNRIERNQLFMPAPSFPPKQAKGEAQKKRIEKALKDFWYFDKLYFPKEMYGDGYYDVSWFHKEIAELTEQQGAHIILAPRDHGKTAVMKKRFIWKILRGDWFFVGIMSENLPQARRILDSITKLLSSNDRIKHDFPHEIVSDNGDEYSLIFNHTKKVHSFIPLSEGRSARGSNQLFDRLDAVLIDDLETATSALSYDAVTNRLSLIAETKQSTKKSGTLIILGNNHDVSSVYNRIVTMRDDGLLPAGWNIYQYPAWSDNYGALWSEKYDAESESDLRALINPINEQNWQGDYQQTPIEGEGIIFSSLPTFYDELPDDAQGVIYCDPNLSLKNKGDTTAIIPVLYSPSRNEFFVHFLRCKSYSDSNDLLDDVLEMQKLLTRKRVQLIGFDGYVNQESTWTNNVRSWCKIKGLPFPRIEYKTYKVDLLSKTTSFLWNEGKIRLHSDITNADEGKRAIRQILSFSGKKAKKKDDAPDALICAIEMLYEHKYHRRNTSQKRNKPVGIPDSSYLL